jgi:hypothetical protein
MDVSRFPEEGEFFEQDLMQVPQAPYVRHQFPFQRQQCYFPRFQKRLEDYCCLSVFDFRDYWLTSVSGQRIIIQSDLRFRRHRIETEYDMDACVTNLKRLWGDGGGGLIMIDDRFDIKVFNVWRERCEKLSPREAEKLVRTNTVWYFGKNIDSNRYG